MSSGLPRSPLRIDAANMLVCISREFFLVIVQSQDSRLLFELIFSSQITRPSSLDMQVSTDCRWAGITSDVDLEFIAVCLITSIRHDTLFVQQRKHAGVLSLDEFDALRIGLKQKIALRPLNVFVAVLIDFVCEVEFVKVPLQCNRSVRACLTEKKMIRRLTNFILSWMHSLTSRMSGIQYFLWSQYTRVAWDPLKFIYCECFDVASIRSSVFWRTSRHSISV